MKTIFYIKEGRKYTPISEYDNNFLSSIGYGDHLVSVHKNGSCRQTINPAFAPMIAAGRYGKDAVTDSIRSALALRPTSTPITEGQRNAWKKLSEEFGNDVYNLTWPAAQDAADAAVAAMQVEAEKLLSVPSVRKAYEHFMLLCELTKDQYESNS